MVDAKITFMMPETSTVVISSFVPRTGDIIRLHQRRWKVTETIWSYHKPFLSFEHLLDEVLIHLSEVI